MAVDGILTLVCQRCFWSSIVLYYISSAVVVVVVVVVVADFLKWEQNLDGGGCVTLYIKCGGGGGGGGFSKVRTTSLWFESGANLEQPRSAIARTMHPLLGTQHYISRKTKSTRHGIALVVHKNEKARPSFTLNSVSPFWWIIFWPHQAENWWFE